MYLAFDIGGTFVKYGLVTRDGEIVAKDKVSAKNIDSQEAMLETLTRVYFEYVKDNKSVEGIAISSPGAIDTEKGVIYNGGSFPFLHEMEISRRLSEDCDNINVAVENDGKCAGLAEVWLGNAKDVQDAIVCIFGTGIAGAVIKNRKIHRGNRLTAGEFSFLLRSYNRDEKIMTWSGVNSALRLGRNAERIKNLPKNSIDGEKFFEMLENGDSDCVEILKDYCYSIAMECFNLQYIFDPDVICIGGGISEQPVFVQEIKNQVEAVYEKLFIKICKPLIKPCFFNNGSNLIGALFNYLQIYEGVE